MKNNILDITQKLCRKIYSVSLDVYDLNHSTYFIFVAKNWRFAQMSNDLQIRNVQDRLFVTINTQYISPRDYITEQSSDGLLIKFIKSNFPYNLEDSDTIQIIGDLESYA